MSHTFNEMFRYTWVIFHDVRYTWVIQLLKTCKLDNTAQCNSFQKQQGLQCVVFTILRNGKSILFGVSVSRYVIHLSCIIGLESTSRQTTFFHLKREDSTNVCRFKYTYKCSNHGLKVVNRHIDYIIHMVIVFIWNDFVQVLACINNYGRAIVVLMFHGHR